MASKRWTVKLGQNTHEVTWSHKPWLGSYTLRVDGARIKSLTVVTHPLFANIKGYEGYFEDYLLTVFLCPKGSSLDYELMVNSNSVDTGKSMFEGVSPHYVNLGVPVYASQAGIDYQYKMWQELFKDPRASSTPGIKEGVETIQEKIEEAYVVLGDPRKRAAYDAQHLPVSLRSRGKSWRLWMMLVIIGIVLLFVVWLLIVS